MVLVNKVYVRSCRISIINSSRLQILRPRRQGLPGVYFDEPRRRYKESHTQPSKSVVPVLDKMLQISVRRIKWALVV